MKHLHFLTLIVCCFLTANCSEKSDTEIFIAEETDFNGTWEGVIAGNEFSYKIDLNGTSTGNNKSADCQATLTKMDLNGNVLVMRINVTSGPCFDNAVGTFELKDLNILLYTLYDSENSYNKNLPFLSGNLTRK